MTNTYMAIFIILTVSTLSKSNIAEIEQIAYKYRDDIEIENGCKHDPNVLLSGLADYIP